MFVGCLCPRPKLPTYTIATVYVLDPNYLHILLPQSKHKCVTRNMIQWFVAFLNRCFINVLQYYKRALYICMYLCLFTTMMSVSCLTDKQFVLSDNSVDLSSIFALINSTTKDKRNVSCALVTFYYYYWVDTSAGGLLILVNTTRPRGGSRISRQGGRT